MNIALNEVKTQAKRLLKSLNGKQPISVKLTLQMKRLGLTLAGEIKLKHCLVMVSQQLGFENWHHAQLILSGNEQPHSQTDMGSFFYNNACGVFLNLWFATIEEAQQALSSNPKNRWLLPYKKQFIVVERNYLIALNLSADTLSLCSAIQHDLYQGYNTEIWDSIAYEVIRHRKIIS